MKNLSIKLYILSLFLTFQFLGISEVFAQEKINLRLQDEDQKIPIVGATYRFGDQKGISDIEGLISLDYRENTILYLNHLSYGAWFLTPSEVITASQSGIISRKETMLGLQPVSIISIKMTEEKDKKIILSDQERLHHDAGAILMLNPAVSGIRKSGSFAFDPVMRGFKYDQLNVVINGIQTANAACPNRMDPPTSQVALNRIKQVEILKGPHALRYGIGLGGTINYIPENPEFTSEAGTYGRFSSLYESNGNIWRNEGRVGFQGANYDIGVLGSYSTGEDYKDGNGNLIPSNFKRGTVGLYGDIQVTKKDLIQLSVNRNFARDVDFPSLAMDLRTDDTWMTSLYHTRSLHGQNLVSWTNSMYFTKVDHLMDNLLRDLNPRMVNASTPASTQNWGLRSEGTWQFDQAKLYAGLDYRSESADGSRTREMLMGPMAGKTFIDPVWQNSQINKTGIFANYTFPIGAYTFTASGRLEVNQAQAHDPAEEFTQLNEEVVNTQVNPGISIGIQRNLGGNFSTGIWAASVRRSGSLLERYINFLPVGLDPWELVGDPQINPETNNQLDWVLGFEKGGIFAEMTIFGSYLTDYISSVKTDLSPRLPSSPGVRRYVNFDKAVKTGLEFSFHQKISSRFSHSLDLAYTYAQDLERDAPLPEVAPLDVRYRWMGQFLDGKLHSGLSLRMVSQQNRVSEAFGEAVTPGFTLIDWDISYPLGDKFFIKGGVQNLLDKAYYEHLSRPIGSDKMPMYAPGRNFFLMVSFKFP
ncbi:TonB-dependent receptor [Algoriphagus kandeliae]|uniref:TonB-dependent receptor n=1 Tax=Algoriphagus kandeliae TaxID=2562278 RepID=A0A4Y9QZK1_9BACT|nr:TonB-dependent receptor plug domain-containing protein [Algoriphagus kandeliae]TFV97158.1 TonB-dependent receptor [Algoriphagus kandeliae]